MEIVTTLQTGNLCTICLKIKLFFFGFADETEFLWNCTVVYLISFYRSLMNGMLETSRKTIKKEAAAGPTIVQEFQHNDLGSK